ncbi:ARM REPEAT PROTEIN INTERACTING WITH ABF2-like [Lotus japonicus]|uniref:ARM REPEAT PROTEIN INTERACTING WITH ABF2-like n=1 Tax=Lotus japonicus TaxID=34305 RepID=UPI0025862268|nr:ARM REPEAT PROTEIN INTERACTING WITH ABF2-like [Lotus japonicus]
MNFDVEVPDGLQIGFVLLVGLLSYKPEYQQPIVDAGVPPYLVDFLRVHKAGLMSQTLVGLLIIIVDTITNLASTNINTMNLIRNEGGIPLLVELLEFNDSCVQRTAAGALRTLAFDNDDNTNQIVECNALPTLVLMLQSEDPTIHYEAISVVRSLIHTSQNIKEVVLEVGALQPVILLLRSSCLKTQKVATSLLGEFATSYSCSKARIAQRGAIRPLVDLLMSSDELLCAMSAFVLGMLAEDSDNQVGIAYNGGIEPLLNLLGSKNEFVQHYAASTLSFVAYNEDNVVDIIKAGGLQKLLNGQFLLQASDYVCRCVAMILKRLKENIYGRVLKHLLNLMRFADKDVQRLVVIALAHLCSPNDHKTIFIVNNGLELLLDLLESKNLKQKSDASAALLKLSAKATFVSIVDAASPLLSSKVYLDEQYVNNPKLSNVTFLVEGKRFYAHRACLQATSDVFHAMFDGGYKESEANDIEIPNIKWDVFRMMIRFIYTGTVDVKLDIAKDLLIAADQYLLEDLKHLCAHAISQDIYVDNVSLMYDMSETYNATSLRNACILFVMEQFDKLSVKPWYCSLVCRIAPSIHKFFSDLLTKPADSEDH